MNFKYYVGGAAAHVGYFLRGIGEWITGHIKSAYHHVRGSWYCHYCGKTHPRRRVKFTMRITLSTITIDELKWGQETTEPTVCHRGVEALKDGSWCP